MPELASIRAGRRGLAVGQAFDAWFARATARRPEARYGRAIDLVEGLAAALGMPLGALGAEPASLPRPSLPSVPDPQSTMAGVARPPAVAQSAVDTDAPATRMALTEQEVRSLRGIVATLAKGKGHSRKPST